MRCGGNLLIGDFRIGRSETSPCQMLHGKVCREGRCPMYSSKVRNIRTNNFYPASGTGTSSAIDNHLTFQLLEDASREVIRVGFRVSEVPVLYLMTFNYGQRKACEVSYPPILDVHDTKVSARLWRNMEIQRQQPGIVRLCYSWDINT